MERVTLSQLVKFVSLCKEKYWRAAMEPGTAVGALCAQVRLLLFLHFLLLLHLFLHSSPSPRVSASRAPR